MKTNYEISIVNNDIHKNECLSEIINNLEKLEIFADDIFNRINRKLIEKKTKIENLKSRIHRANQIISGFENLTQAITIKSKKRYPEKTDLNRSSLYYDDLCDFKLFKSFKIPFNEINQKPFNSSALLGKAPLGSLEDVKTTQEIINDVNRFPDTSSQISFSSSAAKALDPNSLPNNADKFTSYFDFIEKKQVFGNLAAAQHKDILQTSSHTNSAKDSKLMKDFMRSKKKQSVKKPEDDAPVTITSKHQLTRFNKPEEIIRRYTNAELQFNIPMNVNLSHIAQFETNSMPMENYFNEEHEVIIPPQGQIVSDDANSYQTPVDFLKSQNTKQNSNVNPNYNYNNNNNNNIINYNNNNNLNNNGNQNNFNNNSNNNNQYNTQNQNNNYNSNSLSNQTSQQQQINQNSTAPQTSNIPKAPPMPPTAARTSVTMPVVPEAPKIPQAPPVPQVPLPSGQKPIELPQDKDDLRVKIPAVKRASMADEIFFAAEKRRNAAKTTTNDPTKNADKKPLDKAPLSGRGGLMDALRSDNPMARLKKSGSLLVKSNDNTANAPNSNEGNKDGEKKNLQSLEEQIRMRFNMLNKNNVPSKNKKKKNQDTDSFSDKSNSD